MSRILHIALNVFFLVVVFGFAGWVLFRSLKRSEDPPKLIFKLILTSVVVGCAFLVVGPMLQAGGYGGAFVGVPLAAVCGLAMAIIWRHSIADLVANPIASLYDGGKEEVEPKPFYSIAISKRKLNKPIEAIVEIRKQLAKFPKDFEGVTLLANIQVEDMKDLQSAEITFDHFCNPPDAPPRQVAAAWTQMADWHLKLAQDVNSAREALEKIIAKFPDSEVSLAAAQRIAHLGGTEKILLSAHDRQAVFVPEGVNNIGLLDSSEFLRPVEADPAKLAADLVKHLEQYPLDTEAREKLAIIYARHYKRLDLATLELAQLINEPNHPVKRVAHWLNLLADLQVHGGADYETVRETLQKIVERFPGLPVASLARSRLGRLKFEIKGQKKTPGKQLGVYEQNIGLKYGSPYRSPRQL
ncbi:MAG TPA: tetratricopeptide repeat protein [Verrucomicrobiae bacterium]|jgi:tetratricopeptide (TPR) repeat protein|nr:tetratricopeptide repeat protein [Verrucomicrobiae bacterium]